MPYRSLKKTFVNLFDSEPRIFCAPGRVNLIGEHTDYNDGYVFPMALAEKTCVAISPRNDRKLVVQSLRIDDKIERSLNELEPRKDWSDYVAGMAWVIEQAGYPLTGANMLISSNVPLGAGLSSSAAIEISSGLALASTIGLQVDSKTWAKWGQKAENQFVGMNCGIMDQFISVHGKENHALFLDCRTLDYQLVPLPADQIRIIICNTMVKHELGASEYNTRRKECENGVELMKSMYPDIKALRDVSPEQFYKAEHLLDDPVKKRCRHVVTEDQRVLDSIQALQQHDLKTFGQFMNASHDSLRDDYKVSCKELDLMVDIARTLDGCLGARMTGGGFGGSTVNLVLEEFERDFVAAIKESYQTTTGIDPQIVVSVPSAGAKEC
jgi:galactokinase